MTDTNTYRAIGTSTNVVIVFADGETVTVGKDDYSFEDIVAFLKMDTDGIDGEELRGMLTNSTLDERTTFASGKVEKRNGQYFFEGIVVPAKLGGLIETAHNNGEDTKGLITFIENVADNPRSEIYEELYDFLACNEHPITSDGCFLAYKKVRDDYKDFYSRKMDYSIGNVVTERASTVDSDRTRTCSNGLHFCSKDYLPHYYGSQGRVVICKINPAHVGAIPNDYNNAKGRCWEITVVGELDKEETEAAYESVLREHASVSLDDIIMNDSEQSEGYSDHDFAYLDDVRQPEDYGDDAAVSKAQEDAETVAIVAALNKLIDKKVSQKDYVNEFLVSFGKENGLEAAETIEEMVKAYRRNN